MGRNEKSRAAGTAPTQVTKHKEKISQEAIPVKKPGWLAKFLVRSERSRTEIVETVRLSFPNFDKALLSKCEHPEKYGIQLTPKARKLLTEHFDRKDGTT